VEEVVGTKVISTLRARMDKEAADKKCSLAAIIDKKVIATMITLELQIFIC
jgi:hypothetical protein